MQELSGMFGVQKHYVDDDDDVDFFDDEIRQS